MARSTDSSTRWWAKSAAELGPRAMDRTLRANSGWPDVLKSGVLDMDRALKVSGLKPDKSLRVLEIGCGMGRITAALASHFGQVVGIDVSPDLLATAKHNVVDRNVEFVCVTDPALDEFPPASFDVVFSMEVFHHLSREILASYLAAARRVLRPGGQLVFQVHAAPQSIWTAMARIVRMVLYRLGVSEWRGWPNSPGFHRRVHTRAFITATLVQSGFRVEAVNDSNPRDVWYAAVPAE